MSALDLSNADFAALLELAESKFRRWWREESLPERDRRIDDLRGRPLMKNGRAVYRMRICEEFLEHEVRQRIRFYAEVAHESSNAEMLSGQRIQEHRDRIMTSVRHTCSRLKDDIERDARAAGDFSGAALQALLNEQLYTQLQGRILDVVNAELGVLEAEGALAAGREPTGGPSARTIALPVGTSLEIAKRKLIIVQNPKMPAVQLCKRFDLDRVPTPGNWLDERGVGTWDEAYKDLKLRPRIHVLISKARRRHR